MALHDDLKKYIHEYIKYMNKKEYDYGLELVEKIGAMPWSLIK